MNRLIEAARAVVNSGGLPLQGEIGVDSSAFDELCAALDELHPSDEPVT